MRCISCLLLVWSLGACGDPALTVDGAVDGAGPLFDGAGPLIDGAVPPGDGAVLPLVDAATGVADATSPDAAATSPDAGATALGGPCNDHVDNDGDGLIDFPVDWGCNSFDDVSEAEASACSNGLDDDGDGATDYPSDPDCANGAAAWETAAPCVDTTVIGAPMSMTTTLGPNSQLAGATCAGATAGADRVFALSVPSAGRLRVRVGNTSFPVSVYVRRAACDPDSELICSSNPTLVLDVTPGTYFVVVDAAGASGGGQFHIDIAWDCSVLACPTELHCYTYYGDDPTWEPTCLVPECRNGTNETYDATTTIWDTDTLIDFPSDPGCESPNDPWEVDQCPDGGTCPSCGNQIDDDRDGLTDWPDDPDCAAASAWGEATPPACNNGLDDDGDGAIDGDDIGCTSASDQDETNPVCSDGLDNDGDTATDFPDDPGCSGPYDGSEV